MASMRVLGTISIKVFSAKNSNSRRDKSFLTENEAGITTIKEGADNNKESYQRDQPSYSINFNLARRRREASSSDIVPSTTSAGGDILSILDKKLKNAALIPVLGLMATFGLALLGRNFTLKHAYNSAYHKGELFLSKAVCLLNGREALFNRFMSTSSVRFTVLDVGSAAVAHPSKANLWREIERADGSKKYEAFFAHAAGQDAFFASADGLIAVADGVGGWSNAGAVSRFSRTLVNNVAELYVGAEKDPTVLISKAYAAVPRQLLSGASSTIVVGTVVDDTLRIANVGDSGIRVFRQGEGIVYATVEQQHYANCPFQLGGDSVDKPDCAAKSEFRVLPGDVIVAASDGLFDNVFDAEIEDVLTKTVGKAPPLIAKSLLHLAIDMAYPSESPSASKKRRSPFSVKYGMKDWEEGKPDDISIAVGVVM